MSPITIALEGGLAILLIACLAFSWRLERRLSELRKGQDGMRAAAEELMQAVGHAENAVRGLRLTAQDSGRDLQARIDEAKVLAERLGLGAGRIRSSADVAPPQTRYR